MTNIFLFQSVERTLNNLEKFKSQLKYTILRVVTYNSTSTSMALKSFREKF